MFCERCPLQSFSSRNTCTSMGISILSLSIYIFYILVILILTIFPPPHSFVPLVALKTHYTT